MRTEGVNELVRTLERMGQKASRRVLARALRRGAEPIRARAASAAARRAGAPDLADHITISGGRGDGDNVVILVGPSKEERSDQPGKTFDAQGRFLEFGTSDTPAQPFMRPALDGEGDGAARVILDHLWEQIAEQAP